MNPEDRKLQRDRVRRFAIFVGLIFAILFARLWYLQIARGAELLRESEMNRERKIGIAAPRGVIYDRHGKVLATSRPQFVVTVVLEDFRKKPDALPRLADILKLTPEELTSILSKSREVPYAPVRAAIDVPLEIVAAIGERQMLLPGVHVELDQLRHYPDGSAVAHVMGHLGEISKSELERRGSPYKPGDYVGKEKGIEQQYEEVLHGVDGGEVVEVDAMGRKTRTLRDEAPLPGSSITLAIDRRLQIAAYRAMEGRVGAAVALNPKTGEVLCLVNKPDYDPNVFVKGVKRQDWDKIIKNKAHPLQNRAIANKYPPGSTFKPVTATAALEYGVTTSDFKINCGGSYYFGRTFRDWTTHGGGIDLTRAIALSCNVYFYEMGRRLGIDRLSKMAFGYGLSSPTGIDLPGETAGLIPTEEWKRKRYRDKWYPSETLSVAIGQGYVQTTPLQMACVTAAVANDGKLMVPQMVREIRDRHGNVTHSLQPKVRGEVPASLDNIKKVQHGMHQTVVAGTGRVAAVEGVQVAGKTGSAQNRKGMRAHAWFICYAPVEDPTIAIAVLAENGGHGSTGAAPVARAILDVYFEKKKPEEIVSNLAVRAYGN